jgi:hypothetical protein
VIVAPQMAVIILAVEPRGDIRQQNQTEPTSGREISAGIPVPQTYPRRMQWRQAFKYELRPTGENSGACAA